jgi:sugar phosphate isomerase/epimerase
MPLSVFPKGFFSALIERRMSLGEWLELAATLDVDGVELYPAFLDGFEPRYLSDLSRRLRALGLRMPMLCNSPDFVRPDASARRAEVEEARRMIGVTAALGGEYCRVLSGQRRPDVGEEGLGWVIGCLEALIPTAEEAGVVLTLENHYKDGNWEYPEFAQSRERYVAILEALPSPWLRAQYDPSNAVVAGIDPYGLLQDVLDRVATVHASDRYLKGGTVEDLRRLDADPLHGYARLLRHGVIGEGFNDFDQIFRLLGESGFNGWVSIEDGEGVTVEVGMENLRRSVAFLRQKMGQWLPENHDYPARGRSDG